MAITEEGFFALFFKMFALWNFFYMDLQCPRIEFSVHSRNCLKWDRCPLALKKWEHQTVGRRHFVKFKDDSESTLTPFYCRLSSYQSLALCYSHQVSSNLAMNRTQLCHVCQAFAGSVLHRWLPLSYLMSMLWDCWFPRSWNSFCCALIRFCRTFSPLVHKARHVLFASQRVFCLKVWLLPSLISICPIRFVLAVLSLTLYCCLWFLEYLLANQLVHHWHRSKKLLNY